MKAYDYILRVGVLVLASGPFQGAQAQTREATPGGRAGPAVTHALAALGGGTYQLRRVSPGSADIVWDLEAPLLYGMGYGRLAVMDVDVEGGERRNRFTVIDMHSGVVQHRSYPEAHVAHDLSGVAPGIVFRDGGKQACFVTLLIDPQTRLNTGYFVTCLDTLSGAANVTAIPKDMSGPMLVQLSGDEIGVCQRGLRRVMVLTFPNGEYKTVVPAGFRRWGVAASQGFRPPSSQYLYVPDTGLIWASGEGRILRVADSRLKPVSAKAHSLGGPRLVPQLTRFAEKPAIMFGAAKAGGTDISALVIVNLETFAEEWRKPLDFRVRSFAASEDGREVALIDADSGMLKRYSISTDSFVDIAVIPSASAERIRVLHVSADGQLDPTRVDPDIRE